MNQSVLADTGPLFATVDRHDQYHVRARSELRRLERDRIRVALAYPILTECHALIVQRLGPRMAQPWLDVVLAGYLISPTPEDYALASDRLRVYRDQPLTLVDGVLAILSERLDLPVWTFDHHFDVMPVPVWR